MASHGQVELDRTSGRWKSQQRESRYQQDFVPSVRDLTLMSSFNFFKKLDIFVYNRLFLGLYLRFQKASTCRDVLDYADYQSVLRILLSSKVIDLIGS